ncbi:hypothetical protein [Roseovarius aestuariivivens]|uniref:hypothetical protein n=1 Tax=Roseovarius aestuariivivens TaxID=1888910 RepID=UPI001081DB72|nr:hypothetical protein [Roseovarius aestuariivivens]
MTEVFDIAARAAFENTAEFAEPVNTYAVQGLPFGLHAILISMVCAALAAMVLKRRLPGLPLKVCLSLLIAFGTVLAARQTGQREIAIGGFCVIVAIYVIEYFSRVMTSLEEDDASDKSKTDPDCAPSQG